MSIRFFVLISAWQQASAGNNKAEISAKNTVENTAENSAKNKEGEIACDRKHRLIGEWVDGLYSPAGRLLKQETGSSQR